MAKIKKGDNVYVLSGKDKGKTGKVLQVYPAEGKALVENINMMKHFDRPSQQNQAGGVVERETPIRISKLTLLEPKSQKPTRVGWQVSDSGNKIRVCRRTGVSLDSK